ncbi:MAG: class I SAM-dependent methyltransferase [Trueperaceae bacterium]|nr:class I SAM-dependent methyltransferase [Trueperaceae bacterium]
MNTLLPEFFRRVDEQPDGLFYREPRRVMHIDEQASGAARALYDELLPARGQILDLMSSYHSHLPNKFSRVVGLGLNLQELEENPALHEAVIYDLNLNAQLPFDDEQFDGVVCTVSIQYMTRPDDTFKEVARILKPGAPFIITFSNRMFPTKAVLAWRASDDAAHMRLAKSYFAQACEFGNICTRSHAPDEGDPLYALWAYKQTILKS